MNLRLNSFAVVIFVAVSFFQTVAAQTLEPDPFRVSYSLYNGGLHMANSEMILEKSGEFWRWKMSTELRSIYSLFNNKKPYSETIFAIKEDGEKLFNVLITDEKNRNKYESARFDWKTRTADIQRKKKRSVKSFADPVYDYNSIHLLAARMAVYGIKELTVNFYRKGKIIKSTLTYAGNSHLEIDGEKIKTRSFTQSLSESRSVMKYQYGMINPIIPLRIERSHPEKDTSILLIKSAVTGG